MPAEQYIFQDRAVVFLDVLGFQEKLKVFEQEAIDNKEASNTEYYVSERVNEFISTFKEAVSFLNESNYNHYLFSDNICITVDYIQNPNLLIDVLVTISDLFLKFAEKGYFLRGGLEVGKFVDEKSIAVGIPLANAYKLEQNVALYPRIVISSNYKQMLDSFENSSSLSEKSILLKKYILKTHCEVNYLNPFFALVSDDEKIAKIEALKNAIELNLEENKLNERVALKYEWLAGEFNSFIDRYLNEYKYLESETPPEEEIEKIQTFKLTGYGE